MSSPENHRSSKTKHLITAVNSGSIITTNNHHNEEDLNMENNIKVNEIPVRYTSLREVLPAEIRRRSNEEDIHIRNSLVKQVALAYLSPMSTPSSQYESYWWLKKLFSFNNGGGSNNRSVKSFYHKKHYDKIGCIDFLNVTAFGITDDDQDDRYDQGSNYQH